MQLHTYVVTAFGHIAGTCKPTNEHLRYCFVNEHLQLSNVQMWLSSKLCDVCEYQRSNIGPFVKCILKNLRIR